MSDDEPSAEEVAKETGGKVLCSVKLPEDPKLCREGYYTLRKMVKWYGKTYKRPIPNEVQYALRWMREQFGYKKDQTGEVV